MQNIHTDNYRNMNNEEYSLSSSITINERVFSGTLTVITRVH